MVERLFLAVPQGCLQFVIVVFSDHTHLLLLGIQLLFCSNTSSSSSSSSSSSNLNHMAVLSL